MKDGAEQLQLSSVWFVKLFQVHDKLKARDRTKTDIFVPRHTTSQLFVPRSSCLKLAFRPQKLYKKIYIQCYINLSCTVLTCVVMLCLVLFCPVFTVLQTKRTSLCMILTYWSHLTYSTWIHLILFNQWLKCQQCFEISQEPRNINNCNPTHVVLLKGWLNNTQQT